MNKYELVYDLKEHLDTYSQTYDDYIMSYGEVDMIYHYIEEKDKEIERLNNIINELEKWLKYKKEQMEEFELYKRKETGAFWYSTMGNIETFIERIQELKGEDKE